MCWRVKMEKEYVWKGREGVRVCLGGERRSKSMCWRVKMEKEYVWEGREGVRVCLGE